MDSDLHLVWTAPVGFRFTLVLLCGLFLLDSDLHLVWTASVRFIPTLCVRSVPVGFRSTLSVDCPC